MSEENKGEENSPCFITMAPNWLPFSAGVRSIHKLCHEIGKLGYKSYLVPCVKNPDLETPLFTNAVSLKTKGKVIAIYPEGIQGNPLCAPVVARWMLHYPIHEFYGKDEIIFAWIDEFALKDRPFHRLCLPEIDEKFFNAGNLPNERKLICYYARKFKHFGGIVPEEIRKNSIDLDMVEKGDKEILANIYKNSKYLLAFEHTACILEAALCGCPSIYMKNMYLKDIPDIPGTCDSVHLLNKAIEGLPKHVEKYRNECNESKNQIKNLINICLEAAK